MRAEHRPEDLSTWLYPISVTFTLRVTEHWEAVDSHSLEIFKTHLDKVLRSLL